MPVPWESMGSLCPPEVRPQGTGFFMVFIFQGLAPLKCIFGVPLPGIIQICFNLFERLLSQELADPTDQAVRAGVTGCRPV